MFGSLFKVGKEARLQLAERLMDDADPLALLEAERQLSLLRGRERGAASWPPARSSAWPA